MGLLSYVQTLWSSDFVGFGQLARLEADGPDLLIYDPGGRTLARVALDATPIDPAAISTSSLSGPDAFRSIEIGGVTRQLDRGTLDRLGSTNGSQSDYLDGIGFIGFRTTLIEREIDGTRYLYAAREMGSGLETYRIEPSGDLTRVGETDDTADTNADRIVSMATASVAGREFLVTASSSEDGLSVFEVVTGGDLVHRSTFGREEFLPVDTPSIVRTVDVDGTTFVLLGAFGTSSLTALRLDGDGGLSFADQVNDQLGTRFAAATAMDFAQVQGQTLVAVAGNDGGVTLWTLAPSGQLVLRDTLIDTLPAALGGVTQLLFTHVAGTLELFAVSAGENGVARMRIDPGDLGQGATGADGGSGRDVLFADPSGGVLHGNGADDLLIDAAGLDVFFGGSGADHFVFALDNAEDEIRDFDPMTDRIDLSAYPMVRSISDVQVITLADGARLIMGSDSLRVVSHTASPLDTATLSAALLFNGTHVAMLDPPPIIGDASDDVFILSRAVETVDGGGGSDTVDYSDLDRGITLDLGDSSGNGGGAQGDVITNVENVLATDFDDVLSGTIDDNYVVAGNGNDIVDTGAGADWILPGLGVDTIDGGAGNDMVSYADLGAGVTIDLAVGTTTSIGISDTLIDIEGATGSSFDDRITGDADSNRLRGLGGSDWFIASGGGDSYDGGPGTDMVSYVNASAGIGVDLGAGVGLWGMANGDVFTSIERVTGSSFGDEFFGGRAAETFRGLGGPDWFNGSPGNGDRFFGGRGNDTVSYAASGSGVEASLSAGQGLSGDAAGDRYDSIERLTGSSYDDSLTGDNGDNVLRGLGGRDDLRGRGGDDILEGGGSPDRLDGGDGFDVARYALDRDQYDVSLTATGVTVAALSGNEATDTLFNIEALQFADDLFLL